MNLKFIISLILRLTVAVILLQTLYFKFTAHPDSVYIFSTLGAEPWGRICVGILELITAILILNSKTKIIGMISSLVIIIGAVFSHLLVLGVDVKNDNGGLFTLAIIVLYATITFLILNKNEVLLLIHNFYKKEDQDQKNKK